MAKRGRPGQPIKIGAITFPSKVAAAKAFGIPYITLIHRLRNGWTPAQSTGRKVRAYGQRASGPVQVAA